MATLLAQASAPRGEATNHAGDLNNLAWDNVKFSDSGTYPAEVTVKIATRACELQENSNRVNTLGVAHYRAGSDQEALATLLRSVELGGGKPTDWFFLAMVHHRLGDLESARESHDKAIVSVAHPSPDGSNEANWSLENKRMRDEAAEALSIEPEDQNVITNDQSSVNSYGLKRQQYAMLAVSSSAEMVTGRWCVMVPLRTPSI